MNITILATLCSLTTGQCHEQPITSSDYQALTITACLVGAPAVAEFAKSFPQYRVAGWKCVLGKRSEPV